MAKRKGNSVALCNTAGCKCNDFPFNVKLASRCGWITFYCKLHQLIPARHDRGSDRYVSAIKRLAAGSALWHECCDDAVKHRKERRMSAWLKRLETLFVAVAFAEAGEFETAREIAYGKR